LYGQLRKHLGEILHDLAHQKESKILEGHLQPDHVHMLVSIPPKYSVAQVVGFIKGKSVIQIAAPIWAGDGTIMECISGPEATSYQQ
jgi:putative transposase